MSTPRLPARERFRRAWDRLTEIVGTGNVDAAQHALRLCRAYDAVGGDGTAYWNLRLCCDMDITIMIGRCRRDEREEHRQYRREQRAWRRTAGVAVR